MKYLIIFSVTSKSAITPSFIGRMATMFPGVRPSISLAALPTASTLLEILLTATMDGSRTTMPRPSAKTSVFAVPRSMARSEEKMEKKERKAKRRVPFQGARSQVRAPTVSPVLDDHIFRSNGLEAGAVDRAHLDLVEAVAEGDDLAEVAVDVGVGGLRAGARAHGHCGPGLRPALDDDLVADHLRALDDEVGRDLLARTGHLRLPAREHLEAAHGGPLRLHVRLSERLHAPVERAFLRDVDERFGLEAVGVIRDDGIGYEEPAVRD